MGKRALVVTVSVHVHPAGDPKVSGISTMTVLVGEDYSEIRVGENAIGRYKAAKAMMEVRRAERDRIRRLQVPMFAEM